jgi:hypothetical protein
MSPNPRICKCDMEAELDKGAWDMPTKNGVAGSI